MKIHTVHLICRYGCWTFYLSSLTPLTNEKPFYQPKFLYCATGKALRKQFCQGWEASSFYKSSDRDSPDGHLVTRHGRLSKLSCGGVAKQREISSSKAAFHVFSHERNCPAIRSLGSDPICIFWWVFLAFMCFCIHYLLLPNSCFIAAGLGGTNILKSWHFFIYRAALFYF